MPALESKLRSQLDDVCQKARELAVAYARSALQKRAVDAAEPLSHFGPKDKELRNRLRARGRQVGDVRNADGTQSIDQLAQELAYEYWHRMLFARFLAENHLLMHPDGVAVSLEECDELAPEADPPAANGFVLAARYASTMLPQIFRTDDVLLEIDFAPEQRLALEKLLASLPQKTFHADDSLGWSYQFWQSKKKDEVNQIGDKIDGRTLPAVTQLFTEHYMVQFLLHNTIGAWWCGQHGIKGPPGGSGVVPTGQSPVEMEYLRWRDDGTPAAGKFEGWPKALAEFTMLDPCCGSGHFLVAAFNLLVPLRMHDEGLTADQACDAVIRDNIFGLELDPRCTQIAAFALAIAAWKYPNSGGYRSLPPLNLACSGQCVTGKKDEWLALANGDEKLRNGMERLYDLFQQAPHLGSLIEPRREAGDLFIAGFSELNDLISVALDKENTKQTADSAVLAVVARGIAIAFRILCNRYSLVATNVPYLGRREQDDFLKEHFETFHDSAKADLATVFLDRCRRFCRPQGALGLVTPQNWLFLTSYTDLRHELLQSATWRLSVRLGPGAFDTIGGEVVKALLSVIVCDTPAKDSIIFGMDATSEANAAAKAKFLREQTLTCIKQYSVLANPDYRVSLEDISSGKLLQEYASSHQGMSTADNPRFRRVFWEVPQLQRGWVYQLGATDTTKAYAGRENIVWLSAIEAEEKELGAAIRGREVWKRKGIAVRQTVPLPSTLSMGECFDIGVAAVIPKSESDLLPLWAFCSSPAFYEAAKRLDQKKNVTTATLVQVICDMDHWRKIAAKEFPEGLPQPFSDDPTQWLFRGDITGGSSPLQVAVARLLGYRWPEQDKAEDAIDKLADTDGIVCLPGVRGEAAASERLLELLRAAYGKNWSDSVLHKLLTDAGSKVGTTLDEWLRSEFFEQHCKQFDNRPFIWHIWDGRKDGFSALVNYHKLDHKALENLTYSYLGDWITAQSKSDKAGADSRLGAAQELQAKLKLILAGEPPYDIFVRWKTLHEQAIGWNPDLNDGVRMNIRPFMEADILRKKPNIKWGKDRGTEPKRAKDDYPWFWSGKEFVGDRVNEIHLTNAEKQAARSRKKGAK